MIENRLYILNKFWELYDKNGINDAMNFLNENHYFHDNDFEDSLNEINFELMNLKT
jgi:hypothetical protein